MQWPAELTEVDFEIFWKKIVSKDCTSFKIYFKQLKSLYNTSLYGNFLNERSDIVLIDLIAFLVSFS